MFGEFQFKNQTIINMSLVVRKPGFRRPATSTMDQVFDNFFTKDIGGFFGNDFLKDQPSVNIIEKENLFLIELAAPGLEKSNFDVKVEHDQLIISAKKENQENSPEDGKFTRREFSYKAFKRSFKLPENIDTEAINANYEQGILSVSLPKVSVEQSTRVIEIN